MRGIRELAAAGMMVVLIAHRLSAIASADTVYVLDEGRVIERGSPRELLAAGGRRRELWDVHTSSVAVEGGGHGAPVS